jgi:hypothetical protein
VTALPTTDALAKAAAALDAAFSAVLVDADLIRQRAEHRHPELVDDDDPVVVAALNEDEEYGPYLDHVRRVETLANQARTELQWRTSYLAGLTTDPQRAQF